MNFGEILKPIRTPNASYINGFSHFILGTFVPVEIIIEANALPEVGQIYPSKITYFSLFRL